MASLEFKKFHGKLRVALRAVQAAANFCEYLLAKSVDLNKVDKNINSPVTLADFSSDLIIKNEILGHYPNDKFISEENIGFLKKREFHNLRTAMGYYLYKYDEKYSGLIEKFLDINASHIAKLENEYWVIDPLDGTKGYIKGRQYAIALSLIRNNTPYLGVIACPKFNQIPKKSKQRGEIFFSERSRGSFTCSQKELDCYEKLSVNKTKQLKDVFYTESFEGGHTSPETHNKIASYLGIKNSSIKLDSQCKYALVADGGASIYLRFPKRKDHKEYIWDHSAGAILVEEAGGQITDLCGEKIKYMNSKKLYKNTGIIVSNKILHSQLVDACKKFYPLEI